MADARARCPPSPASPRAPTTAPTQQERGTKKKAKREVLPGLEPGLQGSKPWVLTNYTIEPCFTEKALVQILSIHFAHESKRVFIDTDEI